MIEYFTPNSSVTLSEAYLYGSGVVLMAAVYTFTHHPYFFGVMYTGMKVSFFKHYVFVKLLIKVFRLGSPAALSSTENP